MAGLDDSEDWIRQNLGQPAQQMMGPGSAPAQNTDAQAQAMKLAALHALSSNPQAQQGLPSDQIAMQKAMAAKMSAQPGMNAAPNAASMSPQDAQARMSALAQGPDQMAMAAARLRQEGNQEQAHQNELNAYQDRDMSGYKDYHSSDDAQAPRAFNKIQQKVKSQEPVTTDDIRNHLKGMVEVTPELEKQLGYTSGDNEEKDDEKPGTAEGNYR